MSPYLPLIMVLALGAGFAAFSVVASSLTGPARYNRAKLEAYECGIEPTPQAAGGGKVPVRFYLIAMLFIIFDIETVFLFPYAVAFDALGLFAVIQVIIFVGAVAAAFVYVWRRGGLQWD